MSVTFENTGRILITGATGYVGNLLLERLAAGGTPIRCLVRDPSKLTSRAPNDMIEVAAGDVMDASAVRQSLEGVETAYYLIHSMSSSGDFERQDRLAAEQFGSLAHQAGVKRIVYLGGLGDDSDRKLSRHLRSRHEVGEVLRGSGVETIEFRASAVLGKGSLSFDLIRSLTQRLPVMICPRWLATPTQPISVKDLLDYLTAALDLTSDGSRIFEIGTSNIITYGGLIREYAKQKGLKRLLISVPILTPYLSGLWLGLVTPATAEVGRHLIEGLRNPTIIQDPSALEAFTIRPMSTSAAIAQAIED
ncbi:MAG: hypothetical protein Aurels2KO_32400 [Aureliella sp.]